jgi:hypothetical protein
MRRNREVLAVAIVATVVLACGLPSLMVLILLLPLPWERLSDVGQAYGSASAVFSGLALLGVGISLLIQQRQNRTVEVTAVRQRHFELVRLTMEDLKYLYSWGERPPVRYDPALLGFGNLIVTHWWMLWRIGHLGEPELRGHAQRFFAGEVGRDYWRSNSAVWPMPDGSTQRFVAIMSAEFEKANAGGPPTVLPPPFDVDGGGVVPPPSLYATIRRRRATIVGGALLFVLAALGARSLVVRLTRRGFKREAPGD